MSRTTLCESHRGGAWITPYHDAALGLAAEVGVSTYRTHVKGAHLLVDGQRIRRYHGLIPKISPVAVAQIALLQRRIDRMASQLTVDEPWAAARAAEWDAQSMGDWFDHAALRPGVGRDLFEMAVRGLFAPGELTDVSALNLLFLVRAHQSIEKLFSISGGAPENLVDGGMGAVTERVADDLGEALHTSSPVRAITQRSDRVVVIADGITDGITVNAAHAVVAIPPVLALDIAFDPPLPEDRQTLYRAAIAGRETKTILIYDTPFWRENGFSGQSAHPESPSEVTIDCSPSSGSVGVLASFTFGRMASRMAAVAENERRDAVLTDLTRRFGPAAARPSAEVETAWWSDPWTRGCSCAHFPVGILTRHGALLRQPHGRVHWTGTETSTVSHGSIDGAIRSGERASADVLAALDGVTASP